MSCSRIGLAINDLFGHQSCTQPAEIYSDPRLCVSGGGFTGTASQQQTPAVGATATPTGATPAATGYNTAAGYNQQAGYSQQQYAQGYWGQYGYGQGWTQVSLAILWKVLTVYTIRTKVIPVLTPMRLV